MSNYDEAIDLQKLSQRELLVLINNRLEMLEKVNAEQINKQMQTDIEMAVIKTRLQVWSAIIGFGTGLAGSIIVLIITKLFN